MGMSIRIVRYDKDKKEEELACWLKINAISNWFWNKCIKKCEGSGYVKKRLGLMTAMHLEYDCTSVMCDNKRAESILPTNGGVDFFGSPEYDDEYHKNIVGVKNDLCKIISEWDTKFKYYVICSW